MAEDDIQDIDDADVLSTEMVEQAEEEEDEVARSRRRTYYIIGAIALVLIVLLSFAVVLRRRTATIEEEQKADVIVSVKVAKAEKDSIAKEVSAIGTVVPAQRSDVAASISAQIRQMGQLKNKLVKEGDPIAVLSSQDLVAQRNQAQAALDEARLNLQTVQKVQIPQATAQSTKEVNDAKAEADNTRATYERRQTLYQKGGISLKDLEASQLAYTNALDAYWLALSNAEINRTGVNPNSQSIAVAKIKQAQDQLANLQVQVNRGTVRAPISGIVTDQYQFDGEFAQAGAKLVTIADISTVIVKAQFADTVVHDLKVGDAVTVYPMEAPDEKLTGSVTLISRSSDPQNRTVEVWARFGNPQGLLPANGAVQFVVESQPVENAVVVPSSAVTLEATNSDEGTVMIVGPDNIAHETKVKVGVKQGDKTQIVEGLNGGEIVVTEGNYSLPDGTRVEVATEKEGDEEDEK